MGDVIDLKSYKSKRDVGATAEAFTIPTPTYKITVTDYNNGNTLSFEYKRIDQFLDSEELSRIICPYCDRAKGFNGRCNNKECSMGAPDKSS